MTGPSFFQSPELQGLVLVIGGHRPDAVERLTSKRQQIVVMCLSEAERMQHWSYRAVPGVQVIVADPFAIDPEVQQGFDHTFDAVHLMIHSPPLVETARRFVKRGGEVIHD